MRKFVNKKLIVSLFTVLSSISLTIGFGEDQTQTVWAQEDVSSIESTFETQIDSDKTVKLSPNEQVSILIKHINRLISQEEEVTLESLDNSLPEPTEIDEQESLTYYHYTIENVEEIATVQLAVENSDTEQEVKNALAEVEFRTLEMVPLKQDTVEELQEKLVTDYANEEYTTIDAARQILGPTPSVSYLGNYDIYHYQDEEDNEVALMLINNKVVAFNVINQDNTLTEQPFEQTKQQLDRLSHEDGLNRQEIVSIMGQPHAVYYDSSQGIVTYAWYSDVDPDVSAVTYQFAYNGIGIGLMYN